MALPDGALAGLRGLLGLLGHVRGQLAPIADDTGEEPKRTPVGRRLGRRGNRTLKWAFVEAAHGAVRRGGKWRRCFDSVTEGGTKNVNRGYIKVARELVKVVYVVWKKEANYTDSPPPRPGRLAQAPRQRRSALEQAKEFLGDTRSGTGQPCRPMAVVR